MEKKNSYRYTKLDVKKSPSPALTLSPLNNYLPYQSILKYISLSL